VARRAPPLPRSPVLVCLALEKRVLELVGQALLLLGNLLLALGDFSSRQDLGLNDRLHNHLIFFIRKLGRLRPRQRRQLWLEVIIFPRVAHHSRTRTQYSLSACETRELVSE